MAGKMVGRPRKADKFGGHVAAAEKRIADRLPDLIDNMLRRADGGYELIEEKWVPSDDGMAYVLAERKVSRAEPDRMANEYLLNRLLGKPTERHELSGPDGAPIPFETALARVYGDGDAGGGGG